MTNIPEASKVLAPAIKDVKRLLYSGCKESIDLAVNMAENIGFDLEEELEWVDWYEHPDVIFKTPRVYMLKDITTTNSLRLSERWLSELPESIGFLKNIEYIYLTGNSFKKLPSSFKNLTKLKVMFLCNNSTFSIPDYLSRVEITTFQKNKKTLQDTYNEQSKKIGIYKNTKNNI